MTTSGPVEETPQPTDKRSEELAIAEELLRRVVLLRMHGEPTDGSDSWRLFDQDCESFLRRDEAFS